MSLSVYSELYRAAQTRYDSKFIEPPCGDYKCRVTAAEYKEFNKNGAVYDTFTWRLQIIEGALSGSVFERKEFLPTKIDESAARKLGYIKGAVERCGIHAPDDIMYLPDAIKCCIGAELVVSVIDTGNFNKDGKPIKNIKFMELLAKQAVPEPQASQTPQVQAPQAQFGKPNPQDNPEFYEFDNTLY